MQMQNDLFGNPTRNTGTGDQQYENVTKTLDKCSKRAIIPQESIDLNLNPCSATNLSWTALLESPFLPGIFSLHIHHWAPPHTHSTPNLIHCRQKTRPWRINYSNLRLSLPSWSQTCQLVSFSFIVNSFPHRSEDKVSPVPCGPWSPPLAFLRLCISNCLFLCYIFNLFCFLALGRLLIDMPKSFFSP